MHHSPKPEIVFAGPDSARGIWAMADHLEWPEPLALAEAPGACGFAGYGHYEEEYRRQADGWKLQFMRLTRLRVDPLPAGGARASRTLRAASPGWLEALR